MPARDAEVALALPCRTGSRSQGGFHLAQPVRPIAAAVTGVIRIVREGFIDGAGILSRAWSMPVRIIILGLIRLQLTLNIV
jgi:hypothetical protein